MYTHISITKFCTLHIALCILYLIYVGAPNTVAVNDEIPSDDITSQSVVVRWSSVNDIFAVNYTVRWYGEDGSNGIVTVNGLSYTVTGLTANTSYNVTVVAINTCCGAGPVSDVVMVMTNMRPTLPLPTTTIPVPSSTPPPGNIVFFMLAIYVRMLAQNH